MNRIVKDPKERRKEIITLATKLFWENDYEKTSMNQIVAALGIAKGTVYHYFKSKEELMFAVIEAELARYLEQVRKKLKKAPKNAIKKFIYLIGAGQEPDQSKIDHLHKPGNSVLHTRFIARIVTEFSKIYAEVIKEGCEQGLFEVEDPLITAEFLLAGNFIIDEGIYPWDKATIKRRLKALPHLIEKQLSAAPGSFKDLKL